MIYVVFYDLGLGGKAKLCELYVIGSLMDVLAAGRCAPLLPSEELAAGV